MSLNKAFHNPHIVYNVTFIYILCCIPPYTYMCTKTHLYYMWNGLSNFFFQVCINKMKGKISIFLEMQFDIIFFLCIKRYIYIYVMCNSNTTTQLSNPFQLYSIIRIQFPVSIYGCMFKKNIFIQVNIWNWSII